MQLARMRATPLRLRDHRHPVSSSSPSLLTSEVGESDRIGVQENQSFLLISYCCEYLLGSHDHFTLTRSAIVSR